MSYTYAFVGLTPSERALLGSIFDLGSVEGDRLTRVRKAQEANLLLVNGDDRAVVQDLREANPQALMVLVGQPPGSEPMHLPVLRRPLDAPEVVRVLSGLDWPDDNRHSKLNEFEGTFAPSTAFPHQPASAPLIEPAPEDLQQIESWPPEPPRPAVSVRGHALAGLSTGSRLTAVLSAPTPVTAPAPAQQASAPNDADADVMVLVGPLGGKRHTLGHGLRKLGYRVRVVEGSDLGRQLLNQPLAPFVFLDPASLGDQWPSLARALGALRSTPDAPPHVIVVARRGGLIERLRVRMAGCIWMSAPLDRRQLTSFFASRGLLPIYR